LEEIAACLMNRTFFHPLYRKCAQFREEGFCADSSLIVVPDLETGTGTCQTSPPTCHPNIDWVRGGIESSECGCGNSDVEHDGFCVKPFTLATCPEGKVLLPADFTEGHISCPRSMSCVEKDSCPNYRTTAINIKYTESESRKKLKQQFIDDLVCDEGKNSLCCPDDNEDDILIPANILQTYRDPKYECADNPCQDGYWPFEDETGVMKCFPGDETLEGCRDGLTFKNGTQELTCEFFELFSVIADVKKCRRGWMWAPRPKKCIQVFN